MRHIQPCRASVLVEWAVCASAAVAAPAAAQDRPPPQRVDVADGIVLFRSDGWGPAGLEGNSVAVLGENGVLVFDTNGTPAAAAAVLAAIRSMTDLPVRWIVNSHWHWDHWYGTEVYRAAFPDAVVIAHERTRALMAGPALEFNRPGLDAQLPGFLAMLEERVREQEAADPPPAELAQTRRMLAQTRAFLDQKRGVRLVLPDLTFTDALDIDLGGRRVEVRSFGRAVTPGDVVLFAPAERVLLSGDLVLDPVTFALSSYPSEWLAALERVDSLDAAVLVPGHGAPMRDEEHLHATMDAMRETLRLGTAAHARGLDPDAAREEILASLRPHMIRLTDDDPAANRAFEVQFVDWYLHRVWDELEGRLSDAIAPIPPR